MYLNLVFVQAHVSVNLIVVWLPFSLASFTAHSYAYSVALEINI